MKAITSIFFCCKSETSDYTYERAPEPSDVYWENLSITSIQRLFRVCGTYFFTTLIIGACFGIIYGINLANIKV